MRRTSVMHRKQKQNILRRDCGQLRTTFKEFMIFLLDILIGLSRFSLFSQSRNVPFAAVQLSLESCVDRLELLKNDTGRGTEWQKYENGDAIGQELSCNWPNYKKVLDQCQLSAGQEHSSEETKLKVLDILIQCIKQRCSDSIPPELEKLSPLLNITSRSKNRLFSLDSVSTNGIRKWKATEWMATELSKLKEQPFVNEQFVKQGIVVEEILVEWRALKRKLPSLDLDWEHPENLSWENVISQVSADDFFNFISLIDFLGTFISSAEAERGFSQLKVTKTDKRSQLQQRPLQDQLLAKLEGPAIANFDPVPTIESWSRSGKRAKRPSFMDGQTSKFGPKAKKAKLAGTV